MNSNGSMNGLPEDTKLLGETFCMTRKPHIRASHKSVFQPSPTGKHPGGRPPRYKTPEQFEAKAEAYFRRARKRPTITGLTLFLGFCSKDSLYELGKKPEFTDPVKRARTRVEQGYENCLYNQFCTGAIFALKNFGWSDRQNIAHAGEIRSGPLIYLPAVEGFDEQPINGHPAPIVHQAVGAK